MSLQTHAAELRFVPVAGQYEAKGEFDYTTTSANYPSAGGSSLGLAAGAKLTRMLGVGEINYDYNSFLRFWGGFSGGQTQANVITGVFPSIVTDTHTNSGMNEGWLGGQWWTEFESFDVVPQVDLVYPFFRIGGAAVDPLLGEGAMRLQAGSWIMLPFGNLTPFVYGGYAYRDEGRSSLFPYNVGLRYGERRNWWVQGEFRGYQTITDDSNAGNRGPREVILSHTDGGSYEFYSINPSRGEIAASGGFRYESFSVYGGASMSVFGRSSSDGWTAFAGVTFSGFYPKKAPREEQNSFSEKAEKYDQQMFQEPQPLTPDPVIEDTPPPPPPRKKTKSATPKKHKDEPMPNVEMLMKDTEKSLDKNGH